MGPLPTPVDDKQEDVIQTNGVTQKNSVDQTKSDPYYENPPEIEYKLPHSRSENYNPTRPKQTPELQATSDEPGNSKYRMNSQNSQEYSKSLESLVHDESLGNSRDSLVDSIPFGVDGIQTVVKNQLKKEVGSSSKSFVNCLEELTIDSELSSVRDENLQLKKALKEAAFVNQQWREFHDQQQNFVHKLQSTINDLRKETSHKQAAGSSTAAELQKLKDEISQQSKEHQEKTQLLQAQIRTQRDDWEAERCEKQIAEAGRIQADKQVDMLQKILHHLMAKMAVLEEHQRHCMCCYGLFNGFSSPSAEDNSQAALKERRDGRSPSKNSPNSSGSQSRSSSMSIECSSPASPIFSKNHLCVSHSRRSCSPKLKNSSSPGPTHCTCGKGFSYDGQVRDPHGDVASSLRFKASGVTTSQSQHMKESNKIIDQQKIRETMDPNNHCQRTNEPCSGDTQCNAKCGKLKNLPKLNFQPKLSEELDAKHRARTILTSALPSSPSSTKPPSPATLAPPKNLPTTGFPAGSNTQKFRAPFVAHKRPKSVSSSQNIKGKENKEDKTRGSNGKREHRSARRSLDDSVLKNRQEKFAVQDAAVQNSSRRKSTCLGSEKSDANCASLSSNGRRTTQSDLSSAFQTVIHKEKTSPENDKNVVAKNDISNNSNETNFTTTSSHALEDLEDSSKADSSKNESFESNSNYTSIVVMSNSPGIQSSSQVASTTSSRSSSPGISLMTFALNSEGQGVPGAILFAMGSESKSPKTVQHGSNNQTLSVTSVDAKKEQNQERSEGSSEDMPIQKEGKLVNSTWVKLMDKESHPSKSCNGIPWRTARAVPSHQLNSSRKTSSEESNSESCPNASREISPQICNYIQTKSVQTVPDNFSDSTTCSTYSYSFSGDLGAVHREIPTIIYPPCIYSSANSKEPSPNLPNELDLKSLASRNITSAILSHECSGKDAKVSHSRSNRNHTRHKTQKKTYIGGHTPEGWSSMHCLICPQCQMLFHEEQVHSFSKHIQLCGGPKYVDM